MLEIGEIRRFIFRKNGKTIQWYRRRFFQYSIETLNSQKKILHSALKIK